MHKTDERILISRGGRLVPRVPEEPLISSACNKWTGLCLERHHLQGPSESNGVIDGFQICCNLSGPVSAEWLIGGLWRDASLNEGDLCIATHGEFRSVVWRNSYELLLISISPLLMAEVSRQAGSVRPVELAAQIAFRDLNIENICRLLLADTVAGAPAGPLYGEHLACSLTMYLAEQFGQVGKQAHITGSSLPGPVLKRVCELIEARLNTPIGLQDLAREANMSLFYFSRIFRNSTGKSPYHYLTQRRIERAKEMLSRGCSVEEVARASGFSSPSHLGSLFRRYVGVTPLRFRSFFQQRTRDAGTWPAPPAR